MGGRGASSGTSAARTGGGGSAGTAASAMGATGAHVDSEARALAAKVFGTTDPHAFTALLEAPAGYAIRVDRFVADGGKIEVYGIVRTTSDHFAGEFGATFSREGGRLIAKTDNLLMESAHQGRGIGAAVARNMENTYRKLGVSEVRLHASQVGRYVWAKAGYQWSSSTGRSMESAFRGWLSRNGHSPNEAGVALRGAQALAESTHGKAFLLSSDAPNWHGSKPL